MLTVTKVIAITEVTVVTAVYAVTALTAAMAWLGVRTGAVESPVGSDTGWLGLAQQEKLSLRAEMPENQI